jgi:tRNA modification GTPase
MTSYYPDTIMAIATPPQNGAIGIIRLSGQKSLEAVKQHFKPHNKDLAQFQPRKFYLGRIISDEGVLVDHALVVSMPGPHSFTGEDVVEIHCHGNQIILKKIVSEILKRQRALEIRAADPGEFTKRAFLNGKMDLTQAEAVHEIISASSEQALKGSLANLDGKLSLMIQFIRKELCEMLALVESGFEFSDQDSVATYSADALLKRFSCLSDELYFLTAAYSTSKLFDQGISVAIIGAPNVGKSSLLNALLVEDRAIVTDTAGTTRDVVEGARMIGGLRFIFKDTAGLRIATNDIEAEGIRRSHEAAEKADLVLEIFDDPDAAREPRTLKKVCSKKQLRLSVLNKIDRLSEKEMFSVKAKPDSKFDCLVSAKTRDGICLLEDLLFKTINAHYSVQNNVHINQRQHDKALAALNNIKKINELIDDGHKNDELLAEEIRTTIGFLDEIIGTITDDDVLSQIFSRFCVGK